MADWRDVLDVVGDLTDIVAGEADRSEEKARGREAREDAILDSAGRLGEAVDAFENGNAGDRIGGVAAGLAVGRGLLEDAAGAIFGTNQSYNDGDTPAEVERRTREAEEIQRIERESQQRSRASETERFATAAGQCRTDPQIENVARSFLREDELGETKCDNYLSRHSNCPNLSEKARICFE